MQDVVVALQMAPVPAAPALRVLAPVCPPRLTGQDASSGMEASGAHLLWGSGRATNARMCQ